MKKRDGITMATLIITLIISVILMGVTVYGVFNWTKKAGDSKIYSALSFVYRRLSDLEGIKEECREGHLVLKENLEVVLNYLKIYLVFHQQAFQMEPQYHLIMIYMN